MKKILSESLTDFLFEREPFKGYIPTGLTVDDVDSKEFLLGLVIEKRHSKDLGIQRELVLQNLSDDPKFYSKAVKKGLFDEVEILNTYKKYFIDKKDIGEKEETK